MDRRTFLKLAALAGPSLVLGCSTDTEKAASPPQAVNERLIEVNIPRGQECRARKIIKETVQAKFPDAYFFGSELDSLETLVRDHFLQQLASKDPPIPYHFELPADYLKPSMEFSILVEKGPKILTLSEDPQGIVRWKVPVAIGGLAYDHRVKGMRTFRTPPGDYYLVRVVENPTWYPPAWFKDLKPVPPGPDNPYGPWLAELCKAPVRGTYGIFPPADSKLRLHGTSYVFDRGRSRNNTHGCISLYPSKMNEFFEALLHFSPHAEGRYVRGKGTIYLLENPIPFRFA
ncbi:MAG: L,D-transpeptidase [Nanoarchaeota archaeon]